MRNPGRVLANGQKNDFDWPGRGKQIAKAFIHFIFFHPVEITISQNHQPAVPIGLCSYKSRYAFSTAARGVPTGGFHGLNSIYAGLCLLRTGYAMLSSPQTPWDTP